MRGLTLTGFGPRASGLGLRDAGAEGTREEKSCGSPQPAARGPEYWRSLEELAETPAFQEYLHREFPSQASEFTDPVARREFLKLMGASLALAGATACTKQPPEKIVPYVRQPEEVVPGRPLFFATALSLGGIATGVLVESHLGRPTKVEGNPDHPASLGATDVYTQAAILDLYDPDRAQTITYFGEIRPWSAFLGAARATIDAQKTAGGAGFHILTETVGSPTVASQIQDLLRSYPNARWYQYEPLAADHMRSAARLAFGAPAATYYKLDIADVIVSLDADFLSCGPANLKYAREFAARRQPENSDGMNRLYVVECSMSASGARADHRLPLRATDIGRFAFELARQAGVGVNGPSGLGESATKFAGAIALDLKAHRGRSAVIVGEAQPDWVHALAHAMNYALGNVGATVMHVQPIESRPEDHLASIGALASEMDAGRVQALIIIGGNPAFNAPVDLQFADKLRRLSEDRSKLTVHLGTHFDETSALSQWHIPQTHELETWSDARAFDGTASIVQPLIAPLYGGKSAHELLAAFTERPERTAYELVREHWMQSSGFKPATPATQAVSRTTASLVQGVSPAANHQAPPPRGAPKLGSLNRQPSEGGRSPRPEPAAAPSPQVAAFEKMWRRALHAGVIDGTAAAPIAAIAPRSLAGDFAAQLQTPAADSLDIAFRPDPSIYDGRFANNGWLQELPRPLTKITWDNAALMSPTTAERLGVTNEDVVKLRLEGREVEAPVWIVPGHADQAVTVHLGHGRTRAGRVGTGTGFNGYALRSTKSMWQSRGLTVEKAGRRWPLAVTQRHHLMEGRNFVRAATLEEFHKNPHFAKELEEEPPRTLTLYPEYKYDGYAWGMAIDVNACVGCNACVIACQSENNIPVVGKDQVARAREMHWLRVDSYYRGDIANPEAYFQPVPCMHCENAPCEVVCPVGATVHSHEGLNDMVYNRCVGTRYCSNNCPYKVRRFNFLLYQDWSTPSLKLMRNPDVTVRSRGVMEKCTYCVQRINAAKIDAEKENRPVRDGEIATACQAACPASAIVFGDINDPNSRVSKLRAQERHYALLAELNTRPRTTYLAAIRNPNPELKDTNS